MRRARLKSAVLLAIWRPRPSRLLKLSKDLPRDRKAQRLFLGFAA
jgi:hypothetical protein